MRNVTYISAGAGSGKTYTLTSRLEELIRSGKVRPSEVILTTFTKKAAENFKERASARLYAAGMYEEAQELDQAMIGTVHSVASLFIQKYWFHLGLSPELGVMADEDVDFYISQSLADIASPEDIRVLNNFREQFGFTLGFGSTQPDYDYWKRDLRRVVDYSISHDVTDFSESLAYSLEQATRVYRPFCHLNIDKKALRAALEELEREFRAEKKESQAKQKRVDRVVELLAGVRDARIHWLYETVEFIKSKPKSCKAPLADELADSLMNLWHSEEVHALITGYIRLIFDFASRWRANFEAFKKEKHLIDYNDMEKYMLALLRRPEVAEDIRASYKYLFVDEFQDSSPIQVKIFDSLSDLMEGSCWVGDNKQAIYGFRGSDTELTQAVAEIVERGEEGCATETLGCSYRSGRSLVELSNRMFCKVFEHILPPEKVALQPKNEDEVEAPLVYWALPQKADACMDQLARRIERLLTHERPSDVAVLARGNAELDRLAEKLSAEYGIPVNRESGDLSGLKETELLSAVLSLIVDNSNEVAKAKIAYLTVPGFGVGRMIDSKLTHEERRRNLPEGETLPGWLDDVPLVARTLQIRDQLQRQSVGALVESAVTVLAIRDIVCQWGEGEKRIANLSTLMDVARAYDDRCLQLSLAATVPGYLAYLDQCRPAGAGDASGIQLLTYHGSKGLEWKVTILLSLDDDPVEENNLVRRGFFGVQTVREVAPTAEDLYPAMKISLLPWTFGAKKKAPEDMHGEIVSSEGFKRLRRTTLEESARLLYVGVTRPKSCLVLGVKEKGGLRWLDTLHGEIAAEVAAFQPEPMIEVDEPLMAAEEEAPAYGGVRVWGLDRPIVPYPKRNIEPSGVVSEPGQVTMLARSGARIALRASAEDMTEVGSCVHDIFCVLDRLGGEVVSRIVDGYGLRNRFIRSEEITRAWDWLIKELKERYGEPLSVIHEMGFKHWVDGQVVTGSVDLVYRTARGTVVVDYKTFPGSDERVTDPEGSHYAGLYKGQLDCYTRALEAAGETVIDRIVYYPVSGILVSVGF